MTLMLHLKMFQKIYQYYFCGFCESCQSKLALLKNIVLIKIVLIIKTEKSIFFLGFSKAFVFN